MAVHPVAGQWSLTFGALAVIVLVAGCAATPVDNGAQAVEVVDQQPDSTRCKYLGEVVGSQGNWITGDYTSNANLMVGARNDLKNQTFRLAGNTVYVQHAANSSAFGALGTTNTTLIGKAYWCPGAAP